MTPTTERAIRTLVDGGLAPRSLVHRSRGCTEVCFDGGGRHGAFGVLIVGPSGRIVRATLHRGNGAIANPQRATGPREARTLTRDAAAWQQFVSPEQIGV